MRRAALILLCACATPAPRPAAPPPSPTESLIAECAGAAAISCYRKGARLLESRRPEVAQESMDHVDAACAGGVDEACDLAELAFKAPRRIAGRNPVATPAVRGEHIRGTVAVRCRLGVDGILRGCTVLQSVAGMDAEVLDSLSTRVYEPATWGGNPVEVPFDIRIDVTP